MLSKSHELTHVLGKHLDPLAFRKLSSASKSVDFMLRIRPPSKKSVWELLPPEILLMVAKYLRPREALRLMLVNTRTRISVDQPEYWVGPAIHALFRNFSVYEGSRVDVPTFPGNYYLHRIDMSYPEAIRFMVNRSRQFFEIVVHMPDVVSRVTHEEIMLVIFGEQLMHKKMRETSFRSYRDDQRMQIYLTHFNVRYFGKRLETRREITDALKNVILRELKVSFGVLYNSPFRESDEIYDTMYVFWWVRKYYSDRFYHFKTKKFFMELFQISILDEERYIQLHYDPAWCCGWLHETFYVRRQNKFLNKVRNSLLDSPYSADSCRYFFCQFCSLVLFMMRDGRFIRHYRSLHRKLVMASS